MSHVCPGPGCEARVADHMLMCRSHWYQVPRALRNDAWDAWDDGAGAGTMEHVRAISAAIKALEERHK